MSVFQFMLKFTVVLSVENSNLILGFSFLFFFLMLLCIHLVLKFKHFGIFKNKSI